MDFPLLYGKPSSGDKIKVWKLQVIDNITQAIIRRTHGYEGYKETRSERIITEGKNKGRANETTYLEQAIKEAQSLYKKQTEAGYSASKIIDVLPLPMLAVDYNKRGSSINKEFALQAKLDGIRMICYKKDITFYSRTGKLVTHITHINDEITRLFEKIPYAYLDGEFYSHDLPFEVISGLFRKQKLTEKDKDTLKELSFYIFDCFTPTNSDAFEIRYKTLEMSFKIFNFKYLKLVDSLFIANDDTNNIKEIVKKQHNIFVSKGYEGIMIRNSNSEYQVGNRSKHLQKYKEFSDDEYIITNGMEAIGNDIGTVVFSCITKDNIVFNVRPRGSREQRRKWLKDIENIKGKKLTVRYQELSENGVPRFPVGIAIRDYE